MRAERTGEKKEKPCAVPERRGAALGDCRGERRPF